MADMIVSGAGTSAVNGTYVQSGINDGKPKYTKDGFIMSWESGVVWLIHVEPFDYYYRSFDDVATPDLCTTWEEVDGVEPVPTVTAAGGGDPSSIINHVMHYRRLRELQ